MAANYSIMIDKLAGPYLVNNKTLTKFFALVLQKLPQKQSIFNCYRVIWVNK